jgi:hypothetical protein
MNPVKAFTEGPRRDPKMSSSGKALPKSPADTPADSATTIGGENRKLWLIFVVASRLRRMYRLSWKTRPMWGVW